MALDEQHERVLGELERQVAAQDRAFAGRFRVLSQAGLRPQPTMRALLACLLLLAVDAALLTAGARLGQPSFTVASLLVFPFVLAPLYLTGRPRPLRGPRRARRAGQEPTDGSAPPGTS